jgi:hypothetical protein
MSNVRHILCLSISKRHLQLDGKVQDSSKNLRFYRSYYGYTVVQMFMLNANKVFSSDVNYLIYSKLDFDNFVFFSIHTIVTTVIHVVFFCFAVTLWALP